MGARHHLFTYAEYLARERETGLKHEFLNGEVFPMAGASPEHALLVGESAFALGRLCAPKRDRMFLGTIKLRVLATGLATYPDAAMVRGDLELDTEDPNAITNPTLLVEVLSPSTEAYDRGEKWAHYRRIPSLRAYVLVSQIPARLEAYERQADGSFVHRLAEKGERLRLDCLGGEIAVDALYDDRVIEERPG